MASNITTVAARDRLKPQREPYWHKLDTGCMVGFRKMTPDSIGSWVARWRDANSGDRPKKALGEFGHLPASERFSAAKKAAEVWFSHLGRGGATESATVKKICADYVKHIRTRKGDTAADDLAARFRRWVDDEPLGRIDVQKLTRKQVETWRSRLEAAPVVVDPYADAPRTRKRSASSVNRDMSAIRAALNHAHDSRAVTTDAAWRVALRPVENADGRRDIYLDRQQRTALIDKALPDLARFLRAMSMLPLRPGAVAGLTVGHLDQRLGVLSIGQDKAGGDRKIQLPPVSLAFFIECAKDKLATAPLLSRADGRAWDKDGWKGPIKDAVVAAELPFAVTAYTLRHSTITDLVKGGLDLMTVAQLSGTSVAMIEKHYAHLQQDRAAQAIATLAL